MALGVREVSTVKEARFLPPDMRYRDLNEVCSKDQKKVVDGALRCAVSQQQRETSSITVGLDVRGGTKQGTEEESLKLRWLNEPESLLLSLWANETVACSGIKDRKQRVGGSHIDSSLAPWQCLSM